MCGIVAYIGGRDCVPILLEGLARLEYRGYDSAGIAVLSRSGEIRVRKPKGRVADLAAACPRGSRAARASATPAGPPTASRATYAHPHVCGPIAIVHNGIIENADRAAGQAGRGRGRVRLQTDNENLAHLIAASTADDLEEAVRQALASVIGTYGIVVLDAHHPDVIVAARNGSPVVLGLGDKEMFVASDVAAFVRYTRQVITSTTARSRRSARRLRDVHPRRPHHRQETLHHRHRGRLLDAEGYAHFMRKEIHEQPRTVERALAAAWTTGSTPRTSAG